MYINFFYKSNNEIPLSFLRIAFQNSPMANSNTLPLYEKVGIKRTIHRAMDITILSLLIILLSYRMLFIHSHGLCWLQVIALSCESWFTFIWILLVATRWSFFDYKTYPHRLLKREEELPPVDIFVTTADAELEPPIITVNTVLSLLAVDYPAEKLACYVSDDGGSPITFYSLSEALKFARIWVPFCKKYKVQVRAPFRFFNSNNNNDDDYLVSDSSPEFRHEWKKMKEEYEKVRQRIEEAALRDLTGELPHFCNMKSNNHPPIIKVIWENKEAAYDGLPHLIYVCREKIPKHQHHYKAGAMNVLTRVSGLMTNAPYMLNVDCDMFVNNPNILLHAMCLLQDPIIDKEYAFVQFPQSFYNGLKDDPYGNQFHVLLEFIIRGATGLQGPCYMGTGCIHRRKVLYGQSPDGGSDVNNDELLQKTFGKSENLKKSVIHTLRGTTHYPTTRPLDSHYSLGALKEVASCDYEYNSSWGAEVGWVYGSATEDLLTGMTIHKKGWKSVLVSPNPKAFLGFAPSGGPTSLRQQKRWVTGQLEVLFSTKSPIFGLIFDKLQLRQCMFYLWISLWGIRSIPELLYSLLPPYSLIANSPFFPNVQQPAACIPLLLFAIYNLQQLLQYLEVGQSIRAWWNNQKMGRVNTMSAYLFGFIGILLKLLGLSENMFEVTKKGSSSSNDDGEMEEDSSRFTFDDSSLFVPATTILIIQLVALSIGLLRLVEANHVIEEVMVGEMICSVWLILCFWPFLKGMLAKGRFGIPWPTLCKSISLTLLFVSVMLKN
ncbi:cellulose synthase-like protein H1 isoform X2 [Benincasa hispida]|uniref:cellulose synthase-like protein H1 isoform X2 n=1 Tax=Benincasa hispida TaxID=102211 RepID=UPI0019003FEC|nr:cellulose synthase-like protein H1 isoform X2 [Benincasa hispida]